jgi:hypothetical protein
MTKSIVCTRVVRLASSANASLLNPALDDLCLGDGREIRDAGDGVTHGMV